MRPAGSDEMEHPGQPLTVHLASIRKSSQLVPGDGFPGSQSECLRIYNHRLLHLFASELLLDLAEEISRFRFVLNHLIYPVVQTYISLFHTTDHPSMKD